MQAKNRDDAKKVTLFLDLVTSARGKIRNAAIRTTKEGRMMVHPCRRRPGITRPISAVALCM
jgi:hypothetical protein